MKKLNKKTGMGNSSMGKTGIEKIETGIEGFDLISEGGLPKGRTTLIAGTSGSAKTVFAVQFLAERIIKKNEPGVFVTFEEPPEDIRKNVISLGWDVIKWEKEGKWAFVDASGAVLRYRENKDA